MGKAEIEHDTSDAKITETAYGYLGAPTVLCKMLCIFSAALGALNRPVLGCSLGGAPTNSDWPISVPTDCVAG